MWFSKDLLISISILYFPFQVLYSTGNLPFGYLGGAIFSIALWISFIFFLSVKVYKDAENRGADGLLWFIFMYIAYFWALIIWLLVRPPKKEVAERRVVEKVLVCPDCRAVNAPNTRFCPYCRARLW